MNLCKYRELGGVPYEGIHSRRIAGFAVVDILNTVIAAALLAYLFQWNFFLTLTGLVLAGIVLHRVFCVNTALNVKIFGNV